MSLLYGTYTKYATKEVMKIAEEIDSVILEASGYYNIDDAKRPPELKDVMKRWVLSGEKAKDSTSKGQRFHGLYGLRVIWPYREYEWTREISRDGYVDGTYYEDGRKKWDALKAAMDGGWDTEYPVSLLIGKNGEAKVGEGNHRLAVAKEIGLRKVPVKFFFRGRVDGLDYKNPNGPLVNLDRF